MIWTRRERKTILKNERRIKTEGIKRGNGGEKVKGTNGKKKVNKGRTDGATDSP